MPLVTKPGKEKVAQGVRKKDKRSEKAALAKTPSTDWKAAQRTWVLMGLRKVAAPAVLWRAGYSGHVLICEVYSEVLVYLSLGMSYFLLRGYTAIETIKASRPCQIRLTESF